MKCSTRLPVALFGTNGHQVHRKLQNHPQARLAACCHFEQPPLARDHPDYSQMRICQNLDEVLDDQDVQLVVLCSPRRQDQAGHALSALRAGKHVYAEKPCAFSEQDLDAIILEASQRGLVFREMADTAFQAPYFAMREIVQSGILGEVIQINAQKSYPWRDRRPQDEETDGGLIRWCAVHAARWIEHVAGMRITSIQAIETSAGNPRINGGSRMAACLIMNLAGGGVASISANYLNPPGTDVHGYESLTIFGTTGLVESQRGGCVTRLVVGHEDRGGIPEADKSLDYFDLLLGHILQGDSMPLSIEEETNPTRWMIRAKSQMAKPR